MSRLQSARRLSASTEQVRRDVAILLIMLLAGPIVIDTAIAAGSGESMAEYSGDSQLCIACHSAGGEGAARDIFLTTMGTTADPESPFAHANQGCEACHGPSKLHTEKQATAYRPKPKISFSENTPVEESNAVCMNCHDDQGRFHWMGSVHDIEDTGCVDCHSVHVANDPVLKLETQPAVCYACHQEQRAQFLRQSRHPVETGTAVTSHLGLMACTDCHKPHGAVSDGSLVQNTLNETCFVCHAEKRGPFLWEHQPVREDCAICHVPHGSNYEALLTGRQPWLCQRCHVASRHPSGVYSGAGIPPDGAAQQVLAGACMNCHQQVHGSNHPSGIRLTR